MKKIVFIGLILLLFVGCDSKMQNDAQIKSFFNSLSGNALIDSYNIYGRFFNLEGEVSIVNPTLTLVFKNDEKEIEYELYTEVKDNKTHFQTTKLINQGINLDKLEEGNYYVLLKSVQSDKTNYYTLTNKTKYKDLDYYTITKKGENREIKINFQNYKDITYLSVNSKKAKLPKEIYDIVIDPGHGGKDVGANKNGKYESHINLDYALSLKKSLEKLGLKVKLTRSTDITIPTYGENSRVSFAYETKAKLFLSIHQNSAIYNVGSGGVEVYVANHTDLTFATSLAKNIVDNTSTDYSKNKANKIESGVYLRTLSSNDLLDMEKEAKENGYENYPLASTDSTYYYIIRETGGIASGAYVDNRNSDKPWNTYYDSNYGSESYLLELGYLNSTTNLNILLTETDQYVEAITKSIKDYLEI